jgi:hypothetical protein
VSLDGEEPKNPLRVKFNLLSDFKVIWVVQSLAQRYFALAVEQISATSLPHPFPARGAVARRHERGRGCGGRDGVGAQVFAGRVSRERPTGAQDERRQSVRRSRVVLASVADAKPRGDCVDPTGSRPIVNLRGDGDKKEFVAGESAL